MSNIKFPFWEGVRKLLVDRGDNTYAERVEAYPPAVLMTDGDGPYARMRVDVGQTGFFAGREFRCLHEFSILSGANQVIKVVAPINTIVQMFQAEIELAELRVELRVGGTEAGTFNTAVPIFKVNTMTTASNYVGQVTMNTGGTHTGGTLVDLILLKSGTNQNKATQSTASDELPNAFAAGTFYIKLINTDGATATGIFRARWEERP
jgi:hypothetical protein